MKIETDSKGQVTATEDVGVAVAGVPQVNRWSCGDALQAQKHLPTWQAPERKSTIAPGDATMVRDMANELAKQRAS